MFNQSKEEKEFFEKQKASPKQFVEFKELTDRQLLEKQNDLLEQISNSNISIKKNLQFWFYASIIIAIAAILIFK